MEMLKSCIADQLRTIQENEDRAMERVRKGRHVLKKGEGVDRSGSIKRVRSSPALRRTQVKLSLLLLCLLWLSYLCIPPSPCATNRTGWKLIDSQHTVIGYIHLPHVGKDKSMG